MADTPNNKIIAVIMCDLDRAPLGGRSRLLADFHGRPLLHHTVAAACAAPSIAQVTLLCPEAQAQWLRNSIQDVAWPRPVDVLPVASRSPGHRAAEVGRCWNMTSWRGGAGDWTVFDEDYHPQGVKLAATLHSAAHVLTLPAHAALADPQLLEHLLRHHVLNNHSFQLSFLPAAPGLAALALRRALVEQLAVADWLPGRVMAYRPSEPVFDMLGQDASAPVDPLVARLRRRLLLDSDRAWALAAAINPADHRGAAEVCRRVAAADEAEAFGHPQELEIELTTQRLTHPPGDITEAARALRPPWGAKEWQRLLEREHLPDDTLMTFGGDGDPLLFGDAAEFSRLAAAVRAAGALGISLKTDLIENIGTILAAAQAGNMDVVSVMYYGNDAATYQRVAGVDCFAQVTANMERLLDFQRQNGGLPIVVPKLLKVRETLGQLEPFFDKWVERVGWACLDYPTDRAGAVPFAGVMNMAPPLRKPCRRIFQQLLLSADGRVAACDQDMLRTIDAGAGLVGGADIQSVWKGRPLRELRTVHRENRWQEIGVCAACREWHRA